IRCGSGATPDTAFRNRWVAAPVGTCNHRVADRAVRGNAREPTGGPLMTTDPQDTTDTADTTDTKNASDTKDRIAREISIAAPVERVWAVLTEPAHVGSWFGQG